MSVPCLVGRKRFSHTHTRIIKYTPGGRLELGILYGSTYEYELTGSKSGARDESLPAWRDHSVSQCDAYHQSSHIPSAESHPEQ